MDIYYHSYNNTKSVNLRIHILPEIQKTIKNEHTSYLYLISIKTDERKFTKHIPSSSSS